MYHVLQRIRNGEKNKTQRTSSKQQSLDSQSLDSASVREGKWSYIGESITGHGFCLVSLHLLVVIYARYKNKIDGFGPCITVQQIYLTYFLQYLLFRDICEPILVS